jgi:hypothetical protein
LAEAQEATRLGLDRHRFLGGEEHEGIAFMRDRRQDHGTINPIQAQVLRELRLLPSVERFDRSQKKFHGDGVEPKPNDIRCRLAELGSGPLAPSSTADDPRSEFSEKGVPACF